MRNIYHKVFISLVATTDNLVPRTPYFHVGRPVKKSAFRYQRSNKRWERGCTAWLFSYCWLLQSIYAASTKLIQTNIKKSKNNNKYKQTGRN